MAENNDLQHKLINDVYAELGTVSKHSQDAIDYLMRHGWIRTPEETEAAAHDQVPGRTITLERLSAAWESAEIGTPRNGDVVIEGYPTADDLDGGRPDGTSFDVYRVTEDFGPVAESRCLRILSRAPEPTNAEHDLAWWIENANVNNAEDCEACEGDLCPVHYGISMGIDLMARKIAALGDDPELFALIPDPVTAPRGESDE